MSELKIDDKQEDVKEQPEVAEDDKVTCMPCEDDEAEVPLVVRKPVTPSKKEIEEHELTHCPFRSWCEHCVRGQAKDSPHRTVAGELGQSDVTRVVLDYCFITEDVMHKTDDMQEVTQAKTSVTILAMVETQCMSVWGYAVESKGGAETWVTEQILEDMETIGMSNERIILKSDQESSVVDVAKGIARGRQHYGTAIEHSKVGDSNSLKRKDRKSDPISQGLDTNVEISPGGEDQ